VLALVIASSEPSKVPFYVAGAVLVVWAVAVSAHGIRSPSFPRSLSEQRGVIGVTAVLVVITLAMAIHTSAFLHS
jgi:hypothetical protein